MKKKILISLLVLSVILITAVGCTGDIGPVGAVGPPGPQGELGAQGSIGPQGKTGPAGLQGNQGIPGPAGPVGPRGLTGQQGSAGPEGPQGEEGPRGSSGGGSRGSTGPAGSTTTPVFMVDLQVKTTGQALVLTNTTIVKADTYSAQLQTTGTAGNGDEARMVLTPYKPMTLGQITNISWQEYLNTGYPPHVDIRVVKSDGTQESIVIEYGYNTMSHYAEAPMPYGALTGAWYATFSDDGNGPAQVDDTSFGWLASGPSGPPGDATFDANSGTLANWKAGSVVSGIDSSSQVVNITIEVDNWVVQSDAYLDAVKVNGNVVWQ